MGKNIGVNNIFMCTFSFPYLRMAAALPEPEHGVEQCLERVPVDSGETGVQVGHATDAGGGVAGALDVLTPRTVFVKNSASRLQAISYGVPVKMLLDRRERQEVHLLGLHRDLNLIDHILQQKESTTVNTQVEPFGKIKRLTLLAVLHKILHSTSSKSFLLPRQ